MNEVRNMKIDLQGIADRNQWEAKGYRFPQYDIVQMKKATQGEPALGSFWSRKLIPCVSCSHCAENAERWQA